MQNLKYKNNFKEYTESGNIDSEINTNAVTFINKGTSIATINDTYPIGINGGALSISGNIGEFDESNYRVTFASGGVNKLIVINKQYI